MGALTRLARRVWYLLNRRRFERELEREMASHRAMLDDPRRFGSALRLREQNADVWGWSWVDDLRQDLRYALRLLHRAPAFAAAAIITLALGIGASSAIFSVAYGISIRPLPYGDPDRIVRIYEANRSEGNLTQKVSEATYFDWRAGTPSIESMALYSPERARLFPALDQRVTSMSVSASFFDVLGVSPILGRGFKTEQEYGRRADEVVLSYAAWQRLFGGRSDIVGTIVPLDDDTFVVAGVMPAGFDYGPRVDMWRPAFLRPVTAAIVRGWRYDHVVARLRPGATLEQAETELNAVAARLAREYPGTNAGWSVTVSPVRDAIVGDFDRATWLLLTAVAVVLLVACVNVSGLLLVRAAARERETAVREALGARRSRLVRLWLAESAVLTALGTTFGVMLAWLGVTALKVAAPPGIPRLDAIAIDRPALLTALLSAVAATLILTVAPLRWGTAPQPVTARLHGGFRESDARSRRVTRDVLVLAQCAGAVVLVILAVMLTRSFGQLSSFDLGWSATGVVSLKPEPPMPRTAARFYWLTGWSDRLIAQLEATPGVERAAITTSIPMSPNFLPVLIGRGDPTPGEDRRWSGVMHHVTDGYFDAMGISLVAGRTFNASDRFSEALMTLMPPGRLSEGRAVAIVSETLARTLWPGQPAVGQRVRLIIGSVAPAREVVGVIEDLQFHTVGERPMPHVFVPWTQENTGIPYLVARVSGEGSSALSVIARATQSVEPATGIDQMTTLEALVSRATAQPRFTTRIVAGFGALALLLAAIGIYGTLAFIVGARTREIAIRVSLGAARRTIIPDVLRRGLTPVLAGVALGVIVAAALARTFETLLFEVEPLDAPSFLAGTLLLLAAALTASLVPVIRVLDVDPAIALRAE